MPQDQLIDRRILGDSVITEPTLGNHKPQSQSGDHVKQIPPFVLSASTYIKAPLPASLDIDVLHDKAGVLPAYPTLAKESSYIRGLKITSNKQKLQTKNKTDRAVFLIPTASSCYTLVATITLPCFPVRGLDYSYQGRVRVRPLLKA